MPNFAISLLPTVTLGLPGPLMVEVVGLTFSMLDPGANTSKRLSKFFLDILSPCTLRASLKFAARSVKGIERHVFVCRKRDSPSVLVHVDLLFLLRNSSQFPIPYRRGIRLHICRREELPQV